MIETARLRRTASGKKPQYFADPATDKLLSMVLVVTQELSVAFDRIDTLELLLERAGLLTKPAIDGINLDAADHDRRAARRAAMLQRLFRDADRPTAQGKSSGPDEADEAVSSALA